MAPRSDEAQEDFEWLLREIVKGGGDASICEARFIEGLEDESVKALFNAAREADYRQLADEVRLIAERGPVRESRLQVEGELTRLRRRLGAVSAIDFFEASGREAVEGLVSDLERQVRADVATAPWTLRPDDLCDRTWVTRTGVHIDRIATAWLVRRFVDTGAQFKFVPARGYRPARGELRFDMFEAEFTHDGDQCTFEVLLARLGVDDPALRSIAEIVHDVDLKDGKFARPEVAGIESLIAGIAVTHRDDEERLAQGGAVFDGLYAYFRRKRR